MLDVVASYRRFLFLGSEFLTWLWFITENDPEGLAEAAGESITLVVGNRIVLEKKRAEDVERVTIKGETAQMDEGLLALSKGAKVSEVNLVMEIGEIKWSFNIKGENLAMSSLKVPPTGGVKVTDEIEGAILEKIGLCDKPVSIMDALYKKFILLRISEDWTTRHVPAMREWVKPQKKVTSP